MTWFGKPPALSPLLCAKYGWINLESDMLQCRMCRAVICAMLPVNSDPKICELFFLFCKLLSIFTIDIFIMLLPKKITNPSNFKAF